MTNNRRKAERQREIDALLQEGRLAAENGRSREANPYNKFSTNRSHWLAGYDEKIVEMQRSMPQEVTPWFEPGFDEELKALIEAHWPEDPTLDAKRETMRWAKLLLEQDSRCAVSICNGEFKLHGDANFAQDHSWLMVAGFYFDPTAAQFDGKVEYKYYVAREYCDEEALVERLRAQEDREDNTPAKPAQRRP